MNRKISQLRELVAPNGNEEFPLAYDGNTYKLKLKDISKAVSKASIGLGNVDNTSDLDKPVSTAQKAALDLKADLSHKHIPADITGLQALFDAKSNLVHQHTSGDITDWSTAVAATLDTLHVTVTLESVDW